MDDLEIHINGEDGPKRGRGRPRKNGAEAVTDGLGQVAPPGEPVAAAPGPVDEGEGIPVDVEGDSTAPESPAKRGRGRPKKTDEQKEADRLKKLNAPPKPVPAPVPAATPADPSAPLDPNAPPPPKKRGRPLGSKNKPGHQAGRPRKGAMPPRATAPPKIKRPVGRPRKIAKVDGEPDVPSKKQLKEAQEAAEAAHALTLTTAQAQADGGVEGVVDEDSSEDEDIPAGDILVGEPGPSAPKKRGRPVKIPVESTSVIDPALEFGDLATIPEPASKKRGRPLKAEVAEV